MDAAGQKTHTKNYHTSARDHEVKVMPYSFQNYVSSYKMDFIEILYTGTYSFELKPNVVLLMWYSEQQIQLHSHSPCVLESYNQNQQNCRDFLRS